MRRISQTTGARVLWWLGADCDGGSLYFDDADTQVFLRDSWGPIQGSATAPLVAQSASLVFKPFAPTVTGLEAFLDNVFFVEDQTCVTTLNALCLNHERFLVTVEWETLQGASGYDSTTDNVRVYQNPQQTAFAPIQDTDAFATCP